MATKTMYGNLAKQIVEPVEFKYKAALYIRLSNEDSNKEESNSVTSQKAILSNYVEGLPDTEFYDFYIDDDQCTYNEEDLEFINYDPFTQYNDMIFNTQRDFVHYIISCITDNSVDDITDEIIENFDFNDIELYNWLMSDRINDFVESWLYQHESEV